MKDRDYFVVYHYEYTSEAGERRFARGAHIFTSSASTRWMLYQEHLQHIRDNCREVGTPWAPQADFTPHAFDAKVNKLN